ncbi:MAG: hypothetical protein ACYTHJ_00085 [Planctomycetota bacterium]|jgi:hypothetical protein
MDQHFGRLLVTASLLFAMRGTVFGPDAQAGNLPKPMAIQVQANAQVPVDEPPAEPPVAETDLLTMPAGTRIQQHTYVPGTGPVSLGGDPLGTVVYANTRAEFLLPPGADRLIADDVITTAAGGCNLSAYRLLLSGGGDGGQANPFTVDFALYDACPGADGQPIAGTEGSMTFDDDGVHLLTVDLTGQLVAVSNTFWIGVKFSRPGAGWFVGSIADIGFTQNLYHFPTIPCSALTTPLFAGFHAEVFCAGDIDPQFLGYLNTGEGQTTSQGAGNTVLDDVELIVEGCDLTGYQVGLRSNFGDYNAQIELWSDCSADSAIPGTQFTFAGVGDGSIELAATTFDSPISLTQNIFWVAITPDSSSVGPVVSGEPILGESQDIFAIFDQPSNPDACSFFFFNGNPFAAFHVAMFCAGDPPVGGCCASPVPLTGDLCTVTPAFACSDGRWQEGSTCDSEEFDPPCGTASCCLPDASCANLTQDDCSAEDGLWDRTRFCDDDTLTCPFFECLVGEGDCCGDRPGETGCANEGCCQAVCTEDLWCCRVEWDQFCADEAAELCNISCPFGFINWIDPTDGTVDAGQPHEPTSVDEERGIDRIILSGPSGASQGCCWSVCESADSATGNEIQRVEDNGDGTYTLVLQRPLTPGATTTVTYVGANDTGAIVVHPGNVNGDVIADGADVVAMTACLDDAAACVHGTASCDTDRDGVCGPDDLLRLIDLLNGAEMFTPWLDTPLPGTGTCPQ